MSDHYFSTDCKHATRTGQLCLHCVAETSLETIYTHWISLPKDLRFVVTLTDNQPVNFTPIKLFNQNELCIILNIKILLSSRTVMLIVRLNRKFTNNMIPVGYVRLSLNGAGARLDRNWRAKLMGFKNSLR